MVFLNLYSSLSVYLLRNIPVLLDDNCREAAPEDDDCWDAIPGVGLENTGGSTPNVTDNIAIRVAISEDGWKYLKTIWKNLWKQKIYKSPSDICCMLIIIMICYESSS